MIKLHVLSDNKTENPACLAEWGLSLFIEAGGRKILFDTGTSDIFAENAEIMGLDLSEAEALVISHGHSDHTEGVPRFCEINKKAPVYLGKGALLPQFGEEDGGPEDYNCGIQWAEDGALPFKDRLITTDGPVWISPDIVISGRILSDDPLRPQEVFFIQDADGSIRPDPMDHEQFLAVREPGRGIFLFSGCSHKGIISAVEYAKELFPGERIAGIVAGMHLIGADPRLRNRMIRRLKEEEPDVIVPLHCTGLEASARIRYLFGRRCVLASAGSSYEL